MCVWEREIYTANFTLLHSTLIYIHFPEQPLGSTSNHSQLTTTQSQRGDLENHKTHSPSLQPHTSSQNTLWLCRISHTLTSLWKYNYRNHERNRKHLRLQKPWSHVIRSCTNAKLNKNLANFEKLLSKLISISLCLISNCVKIGVFVSKEKLYLYHSKTTRSRQYL